jgi:hypothetical protein
MQMALAILERLRERDRSKRSIAPARRVSGRKMTPDLAHRILEMHRTTSMTQQEIAFELGVNQGRVNEVIKRGKWLSDNPAAPEALARDRALARIEKGIGTKPRARAANRPGSREGRKQPAAGNRSRRGRAEPAQLVLGDLL